RTAQYAGTAGDNKDGILPTDRLELDQVLAQSPFPRIHDLLKLRDQWFWRATSHRIDADRLATHPIHIEAQRGFGGGAALGPASLDHQQVARCVNSHGSGSYSEAVQKLDQSLARYVPKRDDCNPIACVRLARIAINAAVSDRIRSRDQTIASSFAY